MMSGGGGEPEPEPELSYRTLDSSWRPILRPLLSSVDAVDSAEPGTKMELLAEDEVEGKGSFSSGELERELRSMHLAQLEGELGLSYNKIVCILRRADVDNDGQIDYHDFLEAVRHYRLNSEQKSALQSIVHAFAYAEEWRDCVESPPIFMLTLSIVQTIVFVLLALHLARVHNLTLTWDGPVPFCSRLIYNPRRRFELWRFLSYMLVHIGIGHFVFNMLMQLLVGVFLELQQEGFQGSMRVGVVYMAGVLAGSLGTSITDPASFIAGASGGVYALIAAHMATLIINWQEDSAIRVRKVIYKPLTRIVRLCFITFLTVHDVALAVYVRVVLADEANRTGFMGHLSGALAGLLVGVFILENRKVRYFESILQWGALALFGLMITFGVVWNCFGNALSGHQVFPNDDLDLYTGNACNYTLFV